MTNQASESVENGEESNKAAGKKKVAEETTRPDFDLSFLTSIPAARQLQIAIAAGSNTKRTPFTTNMTFILSQLPALQEALRQLRPKLETLPKSADGMQDRSKKDERQEYIDSRIRLHLERTGQLIVSNDENAVVTGRKIQPAEVKALESVTNIL